MNGASLGFRILNTLRHVSLIKQKDKKKAHNTEKSLRLNEIVMLQVNNCQY